MFRKKKICILCSDDLTAINVMVNKKLCNECVIIRKYMIDYGKLDLINYIRSKTLVEPSAPKYN